MRELPQEGGGVGGKRRRGGVKAPMEEGAIALGG